MQIKLPYGKDSVSIDVPDANLLDIVTPEESDSPERPESMIQDALNHPMGTARLSEIATKGDRVAIVVDDHTRPCPTQQLLPPVLDELRQAGVYDSDVIIIIATGTHGVLSFEAMKEIVGDKVSRNYRVICNDAVNGDFIRVGETKRGSPVEILQEYMEADVKVILGDIEYHYFAGYGGTRKSILPGIASEKTVDSNHKLLFEEGAKTGVIKENPVHHEMEEAMHLAGCDFALSVVLNAKQHIVGAWAGTPDAVFNAGVKLVDEMYKVEIDEKADIVVTAASGHPHDLDLYQAYKAAHTALPALKKNGVLILVAECAEGHGNDVYYEWMKKHNSSQQVKKELQDSFVIGAHKAYYHLKTAEEHLVILVSTLDKSEVENVFQFTPASNLDDALKQAFDLQNKNAKVLVIPQGTVTLLTQR